MHFNSTKVGGWEEETTAASEMKKRRINSDANETKRSKSIWLVKQKEIRPKSFDFLRWENFSLTKL